MVVYGSGVKIQPVADLVTAPLKTASLPFKSSSPTKPRFLKHASKPYHKIPYKVVSGQFCSTCEIITVGTAWYTPHMQKETFEEEHLWKITKSLTSKQLQVTTQTQPILCTGSTSLASIAKPCVTLITVEFIHHGKYTNLAIFTDNYCKNQEKHDTMQ